MRSYQQLFAELKRRKVFKVSAVYGALAFALIQVADPLAEVLRLPETFLPFVVGLLLLGFPVAVVLTWAFEMTPDGVQKTGRAEPGEIEQIVALPASERWAAGVLALVGVAALVAGAWWAGRKTAPGTEGAPPEAELAMAVAEDTRPSLAVLPFADMSPEADQQYFSDGITEEILNTLARIRDLRVAGRTSAFAYKGQNKDLRDIGEELGVGYIVEGSVRKAGDQLRITVQLVSAADGSHLWSDQYDRPLGDVFAVQTEIAEAIAGELRVPLGLEAGERLVTPTGDLTAYDLYLAGRMHMRQRGRWLVEAKRLFEAAIARDSSWAPALAALAEVLEVRIWYPEAMEGVYDRQLIDASLAESERLARRALELDPRSASALVALGSVQRDRGEWEQSEASYLRALDLDPDLGEAYMQYGELLLLVGRVAEGVRVTDRAASLDPAPVRFSDLGWALLTDGRASEAVEAFRLGAERDTERGRQDLLVAVGIALLADGRSDEAIEAFGRAVEAGQPLSLGSFPAFGAIAPSRPRIEAFVRAISANDLSNVPPELQPALGPRQWLAFGEPDSAMAELRLISEEGPAANLAWEVWSPEFDGMRDRPEIQELLASRGLAGAEVQRTRPSERRRPTALGPAP